MNDSASLDMELKGVKDHHGSGWMRFTGTANRPSRWNPHPRLSTTLDTSGTCLGARDVIGRDCTATPESSWLGRPHTLVPSIPTMYDDASLTVCI